MGLFKPAWQSKNYTKATKAIESISDQVTLTEAANNALFTNVKKAAVEKITDQTLLADIAINNTDCDVRLEAVYKITQQAVIAEVVIKSKCYLVRSAAVERLNDENLLISVAKKDNHSLVRERAVRKLKDQAVLAYIAENDADKIVRHMAIDKLTDQSVLASIAKNHMIDDMTAFVKLTDKAVMLDVAKSKKGKMRELMYRELFDLYTVDDCCIFIKDISSPYEDRCRCLRALLSLVAESNEVTTEVDEVIRMLICDSSSFPDGISIFAENLFYGLNLGCYKGVPALASKYGFTFEKGNESCYVTYKGERHRIY